MPTRYRIKVKRNVPANVPPRLVIETLQEFEPLLDNHDYIVYYEARDGPTRFSGKELAVIKNDPVFRLDCDDLVLLPSSSSASNQEEEEKRAGEESANHSFYADDADADTLRGDDGDGGSGSNTTTNSNSNSRWQFYDIWEDVYYLPFLLPYFSRLKRYLAIGCKTDAGIRFRVNVSGGVVTRGSFTVVCRETGLPYREADADADADANADADVNGDSNDNHGDNNEDGDTYDSEGETEAGREIGDTAFDLESESPYDLVCECEIEMPLLLTLSQLRMRRPNRNLCERLCKNIIISTAVRQLYVDNESGSNV
jgi:hypothetical protein